MTRDIPHPIPGLYYNFVRPPATESPLRTDVAGFFGRTMRGPVGSPSVSRDGGNTASVFGDLSKDAMTPYALKGYFDNKAQVALRRPVVRGRIDRRRGGVERRDLRCARHAQHADWPGASGLEAVQYQIEATSPGDWAKIDQDRHSLLGGGPSANPSSNSKQSVRQARPPNS